MRFLLRAALTAVAVWFVTILPFDVAVEGGDNGWWQRLLAFLAVGVVIEAINSFVRPLMTLISLPLLILTLGLFSLVISWAVLFLASWLSQYIPGFELTLGGFWDTFWAALVLAITTAILHAIIPGAQRD